MNATVENQSVQQTRSLTTAFKTRLRVYAWLLLGLIPVWAYVLAERIIGPSDTLRMLYGPLAGVPLIVSFWIVASRWETSQKRKLPGRVRGLLTLITLVVAATAIADIIILWVGPGTQLPR